jgi:hypothetical protein
MTYDNLYPNTAGLKQVLGANVMCSFNGQTVVTIDSFAASEAGGLNGRGAFGANGAYTSYGGFPSQMSASRPLLNNTLCWDLIGYADQSNLNQFVTAAITMSGSGPVPGIFIHSGFSPSQGTLIQGASDDWWKGYIAAAMAIEEARAYIMSPVTSSTTAGTPNTFATAFSVTMLAGGWGLGAVKLGAQTVQCGYVDLELTIPNHYQSNVIFIGDPTNPYVAPYPATISLGVADFQLPSSDPSIYAQVDLTRSGWETGGTSTSFEDKAGWWLVGVAVDTLGLWILTPYLGSAIGVLPLLQTNPAAASATNGIAALNQHVFANGTPIDPNSDNWGTVTMYFQAYFPVPTGGGQTQHPIH